MEREYYDGQRPRGVYLVLINQGRGAAHDVRIKVNKDINEPFRLTKINFIKDGVRYMAPNQSYSKLLVSNSAFIKGSFRLTVSYKNELGEEFERKLEIDPKHTNDFYQ